MSWRFHHDRISLPRVPSGGRSPEDKLLEFEGGTGRSGRMEGLYWDHLYFFQKSVKTHNYNGMLDVINHVFEVERLFGIEHI